MAIVGLLLWVGGAIYPWTKAYELEKELIVVEAQVAYAGSHPTQISPLELEIKTKQIRLMFKATIAYFVIGLVSFVTGGFLMHFGFKYWYLRVQKPLDKLLNEK